MPVILDCKTCGKESSHGFTQTVAGIMHYYQDGGCSFYEVRDYTKHPRHFSNGLDAFNYAMTLPAYQTYTKDKLWMDAWRARLSGNEPVANRLFRKWQKRGRL